MSRRRVGSRSSATATVLNGSGAVTPETALRFGRLVKGEPALYVRMQARCNPWLAEQRLKDQLDRIEPAV
ncbi:MAG: hypothetical protein E6G85_00885 [Alphaproteobacteria bacterium]|nr:MAG: hypothetical protein E6G85_00885 [Alphaproteobacteria bacterium]